MITDLIRELVIYGKNNGLICEADEVYATNRLLELFEVMEYEENPEITESRAVCEILEDMMVYAHENGIMREDTITAKDLFDTKIMGCITPPPSVVRQNLRSVMRKARRKQPIIIISSVRLRIISGKTVSQKMRNG